MEIKSHVLLTVPTFPQFHILDITIETILAKIDDTADESGAARTFGIRYLKKVRP